MKNNNLAYGFTLIELLVVVAIIGILASVVLGQLTTARARAVNVSIKATLSNLRTQATLIYGSASPNSYTNLCADPIFVQGLTQIGITGGVPAKCFDADNTWVAAATLKLMEDTSTNWCADSTGKSKGITQAEYDAIISDSTLCP